MISGVHNYHQLWCTVQWSLRYRVSDSMFDMNVFGLLPGSSPKTWMVDIVYCLTVNSGWVNFVSDKNTYVRTLPLAGCCIKGYPSETHKPKFRKLSLVRSFLGFNSVWEFCTDRSRALCKICKRLGNLCVYYRRYLTDERDFARFDIKVSKFRMDATTFSYIYMDVVLRNVNFFADDECPWHIAVRTEWPKLCRHVQLHILKGKLFIVIWTSLKFLP